MNVGRIANPSDSNEFDMNTASNEPRRGRRLKRKWLLSILAVVVVIAAFIAPQPISTLVTDDQQQRWAGDAIPPRREIVWEPPLLVELPEDPDQPDVSLIRPQLTSRENVLYFTQRTANGVSNIYRSVLVVGSWQIAELVDELNSPDNDIGPVITADGKTAYLYSDREGGFGGFDLYVSRMGDNGWSTPENLGSKINTRANEYAPAVAPDGATLVFSSNRTRRMHRYTHAPQDDQEDWKVTLRAEQGMQQYDLYVSRRDDTNEAWPASNAIDVLNEPRSNEGTPWFVPNGAWLYFASDREHRSNELPNYDLYRTRIAGGDFVDVENLGGDINTSANELDPSLSEDGFRLVFSSNRLDESGDDRDPDEILYALYACDATEVFEETVWTESRLPLLLENWWWFVLAALIAGLLAALIYYIRQASLRRAPVPTFFLIALLVHLLLAAGTFFVGLGDDLVAAIRDKLETTFLPDHAADHSHQSHEAGQESYEKVSDLKSYEDVEVKEVFREVQQQPNVAVPNNRVAVNLPVRVVQRELPKQQMEVLPKQATPTDFNPLNRRRPTVQFDQLAKVEPIEIDTPQPEKPQEQPPAQPNVDVDRSMPTETVDPLPQPTQPKFTPNETPVERDILDPTAQSLTMKTRPAADVPLARAVRRELPDFEVPKVETQSNNTPQTSPANDQPTPEAVVEVTRRSAESSSAIPDANVPVETAEPTKANAEPEQFVAETFRSRPIRPVQSTTGPVARIRTTDLTEQFIEAMDVPTGETAAPSDTNSQSNKVQTAEVVVKIQQTDTGNAAAPNQRRDPTLDKLANVEAEASSSATRSLTNQVAMLNTPRSLQNPLTNRRRVQPTIDHDGPQVDTPSDAPASESKSNAPSDETNVNVDRRVAETTSSLSGVSQSAEPMPLAEVTARTSTEAFERPASNTTPKRPTPIKNLLARARLPQTLDRQAIETTQPAATASESADSDSKVLQPTGQAIDVERSDGQPLEATVKTASEVGGRYDQQTRPDVGTLSNEKNDARPSFSTVASRLNRRPARAPETMYANDNVGLRAMFRVRQGEAKELVFNAYGGSDASRQAIDRGLSWIERHQFEDGHWSLNKFDQMCKSHPGKCNGHGTVNSDVAATGFALLPVLGDGHTHRSGKYQAMVERGLNWLLSHQKTDGDLTFGNEGSSHMYSHAIATIALCEAYGMSQDEKLREPVQRAVAFIVAAQHKSLGGWRYHPHKESDTSVVGWQVMALKSAQMAGLEVPKSCFDLVTKWLNKVEAKGTKRGQYGYTNPSPKLTMTAEAMLCREYLGTRHDDVSLLMSANHLLKHLPVAKKDDSYYWYYGTQAMFHLQGDYWKQWNDAMRDMLVETQRKDGVLSGTWDIRDNWEKSGGRIYATSLRMLMLEAPSRHLPLYHMVGE